MGRLMLAGTLGMVSLGQTFTIGGESPTVEFHTTNPLFTPSMKAQFEDKMNGQVDTAFRALMDTARKNLAGFKEQKELAQGFANANAYSVNSATLQGFQNYSLFAVATGLMVGVQAPSTSVSYYGKIAEDIRDKGDLYAGLGAGLSYLNVGVNARFLLPGLYLNAKYGAFSRDVDDFSMDFSVMGLGVNYRLLEPKSLVGLVKWRGVSVGTGFYMQSNKVDMKITPDTIITQAHFRDAVLSGAFDPADSLAKGRLLDEMGYTAANPDAPVKLSPEFNMGVDVRTVTIPFDAATSVSLLFGILNLTAGMGFDLNFGSSEIVLEGASDADIGSDTTKVTFTPATVKVAGSSDNGPSFARLRAMTGVGIGLGPVKIDVPLIYYFNSGAAFGVTAAVVW
ncbi:MAG TPA: hypothetical protein VJ385_04390 [Fibrobacteria bacterium]|nr:hypothetical protein [Fibrobacteria bacterium]